MIAALRNHAEADEGAHLTLIFHPFSAAFTSEPGWEALDEVLGEVIRLSEAEALAGMRMDEAAARAGGRCSACCSASPCAAPPSTTSAGPKTGRARPRALEPGAARVGRCPAGQGQRRGLRRSGSVVTGWPCIRPQRWSPASPRVDGVPVLLMEDVSRVQGPLFRR
jgi:hypothetical protein